MIEPKEINKVATENKVNDRQIERDYVLSWVLFAISKNKILNEAMVFKGGTVLKKAYMDDYRFSEDLDFTLLDETITNDQIKDEFKNSTSLFINATLLLVNEWSVCHTKYSKFFGSDFLIVSANWLLNLCSSIIKICFPLNDSKLSLIRL